MGSRIAGLAVALLPLVPPSPRAPASAGEAGAPAVMADLSVPPAVVADRSPPASDDAYPALMADRHPFATPHMVLAVAVSADRAESRPIGSITATVLRAE